MAQFLHPTNQIYSLRVKACHTMLYYWFNCFKWRWLKFPPYSLMVEYKRDVVYCALFNSILTNSCSRPHHRHTLAANCRFLQVGRRGGEEEERGGGLVGLFFACAWFFDFPMVNTIVQLKEKSEHVAYKSVLDCMYIYNLTFLVNDTLNFVSL